MYLPSPISVLISCGSSSQQPGPGPAGSWAGPAWFKMLLGLGGNQGGGGGGVLSRKKGTFSKKSFAAMVPI